VELSHVSFTGPEFEPASPVVSLLPPNLVALLQQINGFVQFGGGLHVRGVCSTPGWHSLATVMLGEHAIHRHYPAVASTDVPFAQDCVADQFLLREGIVYRLQSETGELQSLEVNLPGFLSAIEAAPIEFLAMQPLLQFQQEGGELQPGQGLHVYPPFCTNEAANGVSLRPIGAEEALAFLANFCCQLSSLAEGSKFKVSIVP
jgi:hypothetical protein